MFSKNDDTHNNYFAQVQQGIDFIEHHLDGEIELSAVANAAGLSQWYFQRIFKALTNETVKTYIRSRRLANALDQLLNTDKKIIDIALLAGYESQESFTRAFKATFHMNPNEYRKVGHNHLFFKKIHIDHDYLRHINQNISLQPEIYLQESIRLVGFKSYFYSVDSEKNNIAEKLIPLWDDFLVSSDKIIDAIPGIYYGMIQPESQYSERLVYHAAMAIKPQTPVNAYSQDFDIVELPAREYAKFTHTGPIADMNNTVNYIYSNWLLNSDYQHTQGPDLEIYDSNYHPTSADSLMYYAIPIR